MVSIKTSLAMSENCTLFLAPLNGSGTLPDVNELKRSLENGSEEVKIEAMKSVLAMLSSGSSTVNSLLMTIIRFVMPNQKNKLLKKLVLLYFEMIPKVDGEGRLLSEMILVCNALRSELEHPNEYVRGVTLRFLCRIKEAEIIEPLDRSIRLCLVLNHHSLVAHCHFNGSFIRSTVTRMLEKTPLWLFLVFLISGTIPSSPMPPN